MPTHATARAFLQAVVQRYRGLSAYSDTGQSHRPNCRLRRLCVFETDFRAPQDFRFAFASPHPYRGLQNLWAQTVVGLSKAGPYCFRTGYGGEESLNRPDDLAMAVAGATGVSSGTAHTIAALLFEEVPGFNLLGLRRLRFRRHRVVNGVRCVAVSGLHPRGGRYTAWFGAEDLLLRRLVKAKLRTEETRTGIRFNHALPDARFDPPARQAKPPAQAAPLAPAA